MVQDAKRMLAPHIKLLTTNTVGFEDRVQLVQRTLSLGKFSTQAGKRLLGIHGMGGVGKTTLALAVHDQAALDFKGRRVYFPVGEECNNEPRLRDMRCKFLKKLSGASSQPSFASVPEEQRALRTALVSGGPLFLVLDDLWTRDQLHWLLACDDSEDTQAAVADLPEGSRILLTSRSRAVVTVAGYEDGLILLEELDDQSSRQLLLEAASSTTCPAPELTADQMQRALRICGGLPLALTVLGRLLRAQPRSKLQVQSTENVWWRDSCSDACMWLLMGVCYSQDFLASFNQKHLTKEKKLLSVLRKSYELLPSDQHRLMFLDAALMLKECPAVHLTSFWEGSMLLDTDDVTSLLPSRAEGEVPVEWQRRRASAAVLAASRLLDDLHESSLVTYTNSGWEDGVGMYVYGPRR